jgi:aminoglycoside phosphotransferase (APT) family kinase protein
MLRRYHDAVRTFEPPADAAWRVCPGAPASGEIVCHNDFAPWNIVYRDGVPRALIDWDFAAPAPALWDVAYAVWRFVPLYYDGKPNSADAAGAEPDLGDYARRLRLFCDAYGLEQRGELLDVVQARQQVMFDTVRQWGEAGVPGFVEMWKTGHAVAPLRDLEFVRRSRRALGSEL